MWCSYALPGYMIVKRHEISTRITTLTEEIEELRTEHRQLMSDSYCSNEIELKEMQETYKEKTESKKKLKEHEENYTAKLEEAAEQFQKLTEQAADVDAGELHDAQLALRKDMEQGAQTSLQNAYGKKFDLSLFAESRTDVSKQLGEDARDTRSIKERIEDSRQRQREQQQIRSKKKNKDIQER